MFAFLLDARATAIPAVAVPASLVGTFGVMYLLGYSIDNLSLMAMTIATGFVIDDAIVVTENITRHLEKGVPPLEAALLGAREIGFTVMTISVSLIVVFLPILAMGGIVGRLLREFGMMLSISIVISMLLSLTVTPMMCAHVLRVRKERRRGSVRTRRAMVCSTACSRATGARWRGRCGTARVVLIILFATVVLNVVLIMRVPEGVLPRAGHGRDLRRHPRAAGRVVRGHG